MKRPGLMLGAGLALAGAALWSVTDVRYTGARVEAPPIAPVPVRAAVPAVEPGPGRFPLPVQGYARGDLRDGWGDPRSGGRGHRGIDLMAAEGTPVVATLSGRVEKLFDSRLGGTTLYLRSADGRWTHYYAHLKGYAAGLREGTRVRAGQVLGYVGDTGDAGAGNHHLHFSTTRMRPGQRWWEGEDVNPYPLLAGERGRR